MGLSFDDYQKMMKSGQIGWNMDIINGTAKQINDMSDLIRGQQTAAEPRLSPGNFQEVQRQYGQISGNVAYMRAYGNFLKQNSPEDYNTLSAHLGEIDRAMAPMKEWVNKGYDPQEYKQAEDARKLYAVREMRGGASAGDVEKKYGFKADEMQELYQNVLEYEKQEELSGKYDNKSVDELLEVIRDPDRLGQQVYNDIAKEYFPGDFQKMIKDKDYDWIFERYGAKYGLSAENVKNIVGQISNYDDKHYESMKGNAPKIADKDEREYILSRILEKGNGDELEKLRKSLPGENDPEYDNWKSLSSAVNDKLINERKMKQYYLDVKEKYPDASDDELEKKGVDVEKFKLWRERYQAQSVNKLQDLLIKAFTQSSPAAAAAASVASVPVNMIGSLVHDVPQYISANIGKLTGGDGYIDPEGTINSKVQAVRDATMEMMGDDHPLAQFLYSVGMSMGESRFAMLVDLIPVVGPALSNAMFFSNAGVSAANDVIKNGGSLEKATATMVAFGAVELLTERFSLGNLKNLQAKGNVKNLKELFFNILKQGGTEGSEEVAATLADSFADGLINRDNSEFNRNIKAYMEQGLSREEAESRAWGDWWKGLAMDAAGGALSGAIFGGATSAANYRTGKQAAKVGNLEVTQAELADLAGEDNKEAVKTAEAIVNQQGVDKVLEAAKLSENEEVKKTAAHFEEVAKKSKLDEGDVAQLLVKASQAQIESNRFDAFAREMGAETRADYIEKSGKSAELLQNYDLSGAKLEEGRTAATSSFGAVHPNGVAAADQNGKQVIVTGIDSSVPEYGRNDNTVSVVLSDGRTVDAGSVIFDNSDIQRLVNMAARFDSVGARALLANYEEAAQSGVGVDAYEQSFARLYEIAQKGSNFESLRKNAEYGADIAALGENVARAAVEAGLADGDISSQTRSFFQKRVRVNGRNFSESKVHFDRDVKLDKNSDVLSVLQGVAEATGKKVVVTHALNTEDKGAYVNNTIYINADQAEHAMVTAALHEAVHNMRAYSEEDFRTLQKFVMNYLVASGQDVERMLASIAALYGKDAPDLDVQVEELVCKTVESLAANREALETALDVKQNKSIREKVGEILQKIADKVMSYFKGDKENGLLAHNRYAQVFLDDAKALQEMAQIVRQGFENAKANEREFGSKESEERFAKIRPSQGEVSGDENIEIDPNARKSKDDTIYLSAVERGDMETAQRMVDEAAERAFNNSKIRDEDGKLLMVYHGSEADFTVFDKTKGRANMDIQGMFFSPWELDASGYGSKVRRFYLNITNPANESTGYRALNRHKGENNAGIKAREDLEQMGFDGVNNEDEEFIAFDSEQIKSADPVTYDDNGNVIPLSERFNKNNSDIRYSKDDTIYSGMYEDGDLYFGDSEEDDDLPFDFGEDDGEDIFYSEDDEKEKTIDVERLMDDYEPREAVYRLYKATASMTEKVIKGYSVKLPRASYEKVARSVMRKFGIREKYNKEMVGELADTIENYIRQIARDKKSAFSTHLNGLATACRKHLEQSVDYTRGVNEEIGKEVADYLHGMTILITPFAESHVMDNHNDSLKSLRRALGGYVNVGFEKDAYKYKQPVYMDDVIDGIAAITGGGTDEYYNTHSPLFPNGERPDSLSGWSWLENVIDTYVRPQMVHRYDGNQHDYYYESVNAAAAEMALEINTAIAGERATAARNKRSEDRKSLQSIDKKYQKLISLNKALSRSKEIQQEKEIERLKSRVMKERGLKEMAREDLDVLKSFVKSDTKNFRAQYLSQERARRDIEAVRRQMAKVRTMIMNPTNEKFIPPEILHNKVFLDTFEALGEAVVLNNRTQAAAKMALLMQQLRAMKKESKKFDGDFETAFDKDFITELQNISDWLKYDTEIKKLHRANFSSDELHDLRLAVDEIIYRIENARKLLLRKDGMLAREASDNVIRETRAIDAKQANKLYSLFSQKLMNPLRVINHMSGFNENSELRKLFYALNEGQRKQWLWEMNAEKLFAAMVEKNEDDYKRACNDVVKYDYTAEGKGYHVEMTRMQALQVMMTWKREAKSRMNHMKRGGIVVADPKKVAKGKGKVWEKAQCVPVSDDLIDQMLKSMGKFEMDYMRTAEHYFNDIAKKAINETFMVTRHREIARSDYYIPVKVDDKFSNREIESLKFDFTIEGAGSYKHITPGAPQPILISSLNSVIDRHIHQTGKLYGLDIPLINFRRMFKGTTNYATESGANWYTADSVKKALSDKFGEESVKYIEDTISKLEGGRKEDLKTFHEVAEFLYRTKVRTSLVGNLGVVIKQAASYPTAGLYLSAKDMSVGLGKFIGKSFTKRYKNVIAEIDAHTAQHYIRRKGMSVQEVADMMRATKLERKIPTVLNPVKWIQGMDCITTAALWEATKSKLNSDYKKAGKKTGTDAYWQEVTQLYDTIIEDTQPMYDELHRSEFQKSGGSLKKAVFPFKTQPLQNMGILADAGAQLAVKRDKQSAVRFAKAVQSQVWSNVVFSLMTFLAAMLRHRFDRYRDEEDRITPASVTPQVFLDMMDNALNTIAPIGGSYVKTLAEDALDSVKNKKLKISNTSNELELNLLNDWLDKFAKAENILQKQLDGTSKASVDPWKLTWKVLDVPGTFSELFGMPYSNLSLLFKGTYNNIAEPVGIAPVNNYGELKVDHIAQHIINAYDSGNSSKGEELTRMWVQQKMSEGQAEAKATENVNKKLAAGLAQTDVAKQAMMAGAGGEYDKAEKLKSELAGKGFSAELVDEATAQALRDVYAMLKDEKPKDREETESLLLDYGFDDTGAAEIAAKWDSQKTNVYTDYQYSDAFNALKNGDKEGFAVVKAAIMTERQKDNKDYSEKDFMSQMKSSNHTKPLFEELEAATDGNDRKRLERVRSQLLNVFGSESEWRAAYQKYVEKKNK